MTAVTQNLTAPSMSAAEARAALREGLSEAERRAAEWVARLGRPGYAQ